MQFSENWLRSMIDPPLSGAELAHVLTMAGLEVEALAAVAPAFSRVVVAEVLEVAKHPNADKLSVCRVDAGPGQILDIVCGAPNVAAGMKVPCALAGAELPGISIKAAKVRGVDSFGMLCSARELGLAEDSSGLLQLPAQARPGASVRELLDLDDTIFTLKLTPNRSDCQSVAGIARELSALTGSVARLPSADPVAPTLDLERAIVLDAPAACPRYLGRIIEGIDARAPTPEWMKRRLARSGLRAISAVVDVTNYVMLEMGQPLHAFDNDKLHGAIHTRFPRPGETLRLLNEQMVAPSPDTLLIADEERALALAGIMGGEESGITLETRTLFLESAFFAPDVVQGKARAMGFASDASHRFERGVDFEGQRAAMERATQLIVDLCGGSAGPISEAIGELPTRLPIRLRPDRVKRVLGIELDGARTEALLSGAGLCCERVGEEFLVSAPSHRFDIAIEEDLIEELARLHGYDNIPAARPMGAMAMLPRPERERQLPRLKQLLTVRDYQEVINFSFVDAEWERDFAGNATPVALANPIASQFGVMRSSLIGGLVANLALNLKRRTSRVRVFEAGRCFGRLEGGGDIAGLNQPVRLGALAAGSAAPEQWAVAVRPVDFFDAKGDVEAILAPARPEFRRCPHPALHPGRCAEILLGGTRIGVVGELHPRWVQKYELGGPVVVFELELESLLERSLPSYLEPSRFPAVVRDLALVVDTELTVQGLLDGLRAAAPAIVQSVELFDLYHGIGLGENKKSVAFRVVMQDTARTLEDAEVDAAMAQIALAAEQGFGARLRGENGE